MEKASLFSSPSSLDNLFLLVLLLLLYSCFYNTTAFVSCNCVEDQKSLLLEIRNDLTVITWATSDWNQTTDCCQWSGVKCDSSTGRVSGLDLGWKDISSGIDSSSSYKMMEGEMRMPLALGKLTSLTYLNLSNVGLSGQVPIDISHLVNLVVLDLSGLNHLYMNKPNLGTIIRNMTNLKELYLDGVNNSAMGNRWCDALSSSLPHLQVLSMSNCDLKGEIHNSLSNLNHLSEISLHGNANLTGPVPEFLADFANLTTLSLADTAITGSVSAKIFQIPTLTTLDLSSNSNLKGTLPEFPNNSSLEVLLLEGMNFSTPLTISITKLKRLRRLDLYSCQFHGSIPSSIGSLERLEELDLSYNQFEGPIPKSLFQLKKLNKLDLSSNSLNGSLQLSELLGSFQQLTVLKLSSNNLSINTDGCDVDSSFPQLEWLDLASCDLHSIPEFLKNQSQLYYLDLSTNHITGTIPGWMWAITNFYLSNNQFVEIEPPLTHSTPGHIDLHSNNLQGEFPFLLSSPDFLDCSNNNFTSIHPNISNDTSSATFISFSRNSLYGSIPPSLCNATNLEILNLEYNHLDGTIPDCLFTMPQLFVLNLRGNNLGGDIPDEFVKGSNLQTLQLNENSLLGQIPRSLEHCIPLKVLDLGHNQLNDTFPCHLKSLSNLQVLILRSNKFHGTMVCLRGHSIWPLLQIIDIASNHFSGDLGNFLFQEWKSMIAAKSGVELEQKYLESYGGNGVYYQNSVTITSKGLSQDLQYILKIFSSIDLSNNAFYGELSTGLGKLNALVVLNLSHNFLFGHVPPSIGNLYQLESLDLSFNTFSGNIPPQLANLNFLGYLNLSCNKLSGKIPTGPQLQTFEVSSYKGNKGLYGPPLTPPVRTIPIRTAPSSSTKGSSWSSKDEIEWMLRGAGVGFPVGITIFLGPLLYITRYREWYCTHLRRLVMKILRKEDSTNGRRTSNRQPRQRC